MAQVLTATGGAIYPRHIDLEAMSRRHSCKFVKKKFYARKKFNKNVVYGVKFDF